MLKIENNSIIFKKNGETVEISALGENSIRVKAYFKGSKAEHRNWALEGVQRREKGNIHESNEGLSLTNGLLKVVVSKLGEISFYNKDSLILKEQYRSFDFDQPHTPALRDVARERKANQCGNFHLRVRFEGYDNEKIYGMGQYQIPYLNLKGTKLELAQKNTQVSIPFFLSSLNYGFLWNNPAVGEATFAKNYTEFVAGGTHFLDYVLIGGDNPKEIINELTDFVGKAPKFPSNLLGLWQSKLRYRSEKEILDVANEYKRRNINLSAIVIDYFHWTRQGEWEFDKEYWPNPKRMCDELHKDNIKVFVSIWPTVDKKSKYFNEMEENGYLIKPIRGTQSYDFQGDCLITDFTDNDAQKYVFDIAKKNYLDYGIDYFWLDQAEPEFTSYDFDNYLFNLGPSIEVANCYPHYYLTAFNKGEGVSLIRSAWFGSQKNGALLWSGDVPGTFEALKDQLCAGLNVGLTGVSWWTTDIGGFSGDINDKVWRELLIRWFEWAVFTPVLRMHGDRRPWNIPPLDDRDFCGGFCHKCQANEIYRFGEETYKILLKNLRLRESLKPYIESLYEESSRNGSPIMRTMFYEFPNDKKCYDVEDQYMFGDKYLVAPILNFGERKRKVYLPIGSWKEIHSNKTYLGKQEIEVDAPLDEIPVFEKIVKVKSL